MQHQALRTHSATAGTYPVASACPSRNGKGQDKTKKAIFHSCPSRCGRGRRLRQGRFLPFALLALSIAAHAAPVTVTPADAPVIQKAIVAQRGHVVLVNFWATWCGPCVAEFPAIVQISRRYKASGLRVFAVSADQVKDTRTKVVPFLTKAGADFPAYVEKSADPEEFIDAFDPAWQGDLPRTIIYDKTGRRVKTLTGEQTAQSLAAALQPYLPASQSNSRSARRYARK